MKRSRRQFIQQGGALTAGALLIGLVPVGIGMAGCKRKWGPNDKVRIALIGTRNMGYTNLTTFLSQADVELVALCDVDRNMMETRAADILKFCVDRTFDIPKPDLYTDFRKILDRKDIDAIIVATPDHWHALITIMGCQAGKDVYVEKPMANSIYEVDEIVEAGKRYERVIQVGQWQRSGLHWKSMVEYLQMGTLGDVSQVDVWRYQGNEVPIQADGAVPEGVDYNMWLGPAPERPFNPNRFHYNFRWFWDYAGGKLTDWGVHLLDMAIWGMGMKNPATISAEGGKLVFPDDAMETPDRLRVDYRFENMQITWRNDFALQTNEYGMDHGLIFYGKNGKLLANRNFWKVLPDETGGGPLIEAVEPQKATGQDLEMHVRDFLDAIKSRRYQTACSAEIGRDVARLAHMGNIAYRTQQQIHWNPESVTFNENAANNLLKPNYRKPWGL